jgi:hypothetical protein
MSAKFLEGFSGKFAEQWTTTLLTPAFVFWAGGAIAAWQKFGWDTLIKWFIPLPEPLQIASLLGIFLIISISAFIVQRFDVIIIQFLEGYSLQKIQWLDKYLIQISKYRRNKVKEQLRTLNNKGIAALKPGEKSQHFQLDRQFHYFPTESDLLPTRLGNVLRSAERRPLNRYGLDAVICWPHLWLLLPDPVRNDLSTSRNDLNAAARTWLWSILFIIWWPSLGAKWAMLGALVALLTYNTWMLDAAATYADLISATFDTHRHLLYKSLRFPLPTNTDTEIADGDRLTNYLWHEHRQAIDFKD